MKTIIIHGDDSNKSYERLKKFIGVAKERNWEVTCLDELNISIGEAISSQSLFPEERFFIHRFVKKIKASDLTWISKKSVKYEGNLVLYSDSIIAKTILNKFPKDAKVEEFKLPVLLWKFLDTIFPGNTKQSLTLLHQILENQPNEFVFFLISGLMRDLYWAKSDSGSMTYPSWRIAKLKSQAARFKDGKLESLIDDLSQIDIRSKTSSENLKDLLDFTFIDQLG